MKKLTISFVLVLVVTIIVTSSFNIPKDIKTKDTVLQDTSSIYKDGSYEGRSRSFYTDEPYWGIARITLKNGSLTGINFMIRDSNLHETFNENYEKHFEGNPVYIQQSRNDWKGVQAYPKKLSETQNVNKIDAISGATWSYNIFRASVNEALKNTK